MFILENHLSTDQNRAVAEVQATAEEANVNVFLAGGTMRDVLGGYQVRDLDFSVEGNALKIAKTLSSRGQAALLSVDENRKSAEAIFPQGVTAQLAMSRQEHYGKPGAKARILPATIQEDLRGRDFTINAIALSLNPASRGLLLDPTNGLADLERRELRALSNYSLYDDPVRLLRMVRLKIRLGFAVEPRTAQQYDSARAAGMETFIPPRALYQELKHIAEEPSPAEVLRALEADRLLTVFSPALTGAKLNLPALARLEKTAHLLPPGNGIRSGLFMLFLYTLTEKFSPRDRSALTRGLGMTKEEVNQLQKLTVRSRKLERAVMGPGARKPAQIGELLARAAGDELLFLACYSKQRSVQERVRNYLHRHAAVQQEEEQPVENASGQNGADQPHEPERPDHRTRQKVSAMGAASGEEFPEDRRRSREA